MAGLIKKNHPDKLRVAARRGVNPKLPSGSGFGLGRWIDRWLAALSAVCVTIGLQESVESDVVCRQQHDAEHEDDTDEDSYFSDTILHYLSLSQRAFRELG